MFFVSELDTSYTLLRQMYQPCDRHGMMSGNDFGRLNSAIYNQAERLYHSKASTIHEEAALCLVLLMSYRATFCNDSNKHQRVQDILDRCWTVLDQLPDSLLKAQLLVACYHEVEEDELIDEAEMIVKSWKEETMSEDKKEVVEEISEVRRKEKETFCSLH